MWNHENHSCSPQHLLSHFDLHMPCDSLLCLQMCAYCLMFFFSLVFCCNLLKEGFCFYWAVVADCVNEQTCLPFLWQTEGGTYQSEVLFSIFPLAFSSCEDGEGQTGCGLFLNFLNSDPFYVCLGGKVRKKASMLNEWCLKTLLNSKKHNAS